MTTKEQHLATLNDYRGPRWHDVLRHADDCDALYDSGVVRVGYTVYVRLNGLTSKATHETEWDAQGAYLDAVRTLGL